MAPHVAVVLDKDVFSPGDFVTGHVLVSTDKPRKCEEITMTAKGAAEVEFTRATQNAPVCTHHLNKELYYKLSHTIWKDGSHILEAGKHSFPIGFEIPFGSPASFKSCFGKVEHVCKVEMKLKNALNVKVKHVLTVISQSSENDAPKMQKSQSRHDTGLSGKDGKVAVKVVLSDTNFVPCEPLIIHAEILNDSQKKIKSTSATLVMSVVHHMRGARRTQRYSVGSALTQGQIPPYSKQAWQGERLTVPHLPASGLEGCKIMDIDYWLEFTVTGKHKSLILRFPIMIGPPITPHTTASCLSTYPHGKALEYRDSVFNTPTGSAFTTPTGSRRQSLDNSGSDGEGLTNGLRKMSLIKNLNAQLHHNSSSSHHLINAKLIE